MTPGAGWAGFGLGALGIVAFSVSLPATKVAVEVLDPWFVAFGRATVAGVLAVGYLAVVERRAAARVRPGRADLVSLAVVVGGVVVGFPLLTSMALRTESAVHGSVVIAVLPAATAVAAVLRARERPGPMFWAASGAGFVAVLVFVGLTSGTTGAGGGPLVGGGDLLLLAAVVVCAAGYAEGAVLGRRWGGPRAICWALVLALPLTATVTALVVARGGIAPALDGGVWSHPGPWLAFGYVSGVSMFLGFFAWYAGLARGGIARVGQVQLAQPVLSLGWAAVLLGEPVTSTAVVAALAVLACVAATQRAR